MDQEEIVDSLKEHLDSLEEIVKWALLLAVAFWWAGVQRSEKIEALGMEIKRQHALWVAVVFYLINNIAVLDKLLRLGDLFSMVDKNHLEKAISRVALHPWVANPFSYFGGSLLARIHSAKGFGALIVVWWVCNSSLYSLSVVVLSPLALILQGLFLLIGLASMTAINRVYSIVVVQAKSQGSTLYSHLNATRWERSALAFIGIGIGGAIAFATQILWLRP